MANTLVGTINTTPEFVVIPGSGNSGIVTRLNPLNRYEVTVDQVDGRLAIEDGITVKNGIGDVLPVRLTELIDVNTAVLVDGSFLRYDATSTFFEFSTLTDFVDLSVSNTLTIEAVSANGSVGTPGQVLTSDGTNTYWNDPFTFPDEIDGGILP